MRIWSMSNDDVSCTMHVTLAAAADGDVVRGAVANMIRDRFGIEHVTIQIEGLGEACRESDHLHA
ncbi:cation transporter dimerization domain-containing protein [Sphingomonas desiccabilis]|uniref:cation transporter dimerization domain-containing protein n=1 Tax=Sphingomonas desiccabilis TaxID=429134 RepID=UPI0040643E20